MPLPPNPWLSLTSSVPYVASCDYSKINSLTSREKGKIYLDLYPEPYIGDPDADVYLLNGNPGYSDMDNCFSYPCFPMSVFSDVYSHKRRDFIWNDTSDPIQINCPRTGRTIVHPGHNYWQKHLKELTQYVGHNPRLFVLEFYPYHSKSFLTCMSKPLPSFDYTRALVEDAIVKNKMIFLLRHQMDWMSAVPNLRFHSICTLKNPQCTYLTPENMSSEVWQMLITRC